MADLAGQAGSHPDLIGRVCRTYRGAPSATAPVRNLIGANMSFRRELFTAVGGFSQCDRPLLAHTRGLRRPSCAFAFASAA
ncbi:MAG: hypothetical protein U0Z44_15460 [Kouleothrix sp.]